MDFEQAAALQEKVKGAGFEGVEIGFPASTSNSMAWILMVRDPANGRPHQLMDDDEVAHFLGTVAPF